MKTCKARAIALVVAIGATALVGGAPRIELETSQQTAATRNLVRSVDGLALAISTSREHPEPRPIEKPCLEGLDDRHSDLCAQWKAADAARSSAQWTFWSVIVGAMGLIGVVGTLAYSAATLRRATEANELSRKTSILQLRAYIAVEDLRIDDLVPGKHPTASFTIRNVGATIARGVVATAQVIRQSESPTGKWHVPKGFTPSKFDLPPGGEVHRSFTWPTPLTVAEISAHPMPRLFYYAGVVSYRDIYGRTRRTIFRQTAAANYLKDGSGPLVPFNRKGNRSS